MMENTGKVDAVVIGGGFYGSAIAIYLARQRGLNKVLLIERESDLLTRASHTNQARVHNGYHYPRSFTTAFRSRVNYPRFLHDWPAAIKQDFTKLYAIARRNSKVTARQFERFCHEIDANIKPADPELKNLFEPSLIEEVFLVEECAFDTKKLAQWAKIELANNGIELHFDSRVIDISNLPENELSVTIERKDSSRDSINCRYVFNCTYSGLNQLSGDYPGTQTQLKHEVTEMALMKMPDALKSIGITVMDGPFFSLMPFPSRDLHTLSHVRYTPHFHWKDECGVDPYQKLHGYEKSTRVDRMVRDVQRYLPAVMDAKYVESLFEIKTVLIKNEGDDGRPILFERHRDQPGCYSILGGKIDNIYDALEKLDNEFLK